LFFGLPTTVPVAVVGPVVDKDEDWAFSRSACRFCFFLCFKCSVCSCKKVFFRFDVEDDLASSFSLVTFFHFNIFSFRSAIGDGDNDNDDDNSDGGARLKKDDILDKGSDEDSED